MKAKQRRIQLHILGKIMNLPKIAAIALALSVVTAQSAQAETFKAFSDRVNRAAIGMMKAHGHEGANQNWLSSDASAMLDDAEFLKQSLSDAVASCDRYQQRKLWWSPAAYNRFTHGLLAEMIQGVPTFAPNAAQQEKVHFAVLASAVAYEAEKTVCPSIVWRQ